jgi:hypothetical protein
MPASFEENIYIVTFANEKGCVYFVFESIFLEGRLK